MDFQAPELSEPLRSRDLWKLCRLMLAASCFILVPFQTELLFSARVLTRSTERPGEEVLTLAALHHADAILASSPPWRPFIGCHSTRTASSKAEGRTGKLQLCFSNWFSTIFALLEG